ncbi:MAG: PcfJ domain-containing protein [Treponema sp.]|nr:PcfJ domain-containing protein [Treponema sp.]
MIEKIYFYRKFGTADFILSEKEKKIIPVRIKNQFLPDNLVYNWSNNIWEKADSIPEENDETLPAEFVEFPVRSVKPSFSGHGVLSDERGLSIEDLSPCEMADYCAWKREESRYFFNSRNFKDANDSQKDYFGAELCVDEEKLTLSLTFKKFARKELEGRDYMNRHIDSKFPVYFSEAIERPSFISETIFFDMKEGNISFDFDSNSEPWRLKQNSHKEFLPFELHDKILQLLGNLEFYFYPQSVLCAAYKKLSELAKKFTGLSEAPATINYLSEENTKPRYLSEMYVLTKLPCEPNLYEVLMNKELNDLKFNFKYDRSDTKVLGSFLQKAHLKDYRILRKVYAKHPIVLLLCMRLHDSGFRDINLYNRVIESEENREEIRHLDRKSLVFFSKYSIKKRGQLSTMNTILRKSEDVDYFMKDDAFCMFRSYFRHIPEELRKDILEDGFTRFNHDALCKVSFSAENRSITFKYSGEQKNLEDAIDGYSFRLPKTNMQMCEIGTALHNCVASYAEIVEGKECTIVYAEKDGEYKICIEVRGKEVCQERIDRNEAPTGEEKAVLSKWHERHGLKIVV